MESSTENVVGATEPSLTPFCMTNAKLSEVHKNRGRKFRPLYSDKYIHSLATK